MFEDFSNEDHFIEHIAKRKLTGNTSAITGWITRSALGSTRPATFGMPIPFMLVLRCRILMITNSLFPSHPVE